MLKERLQAVLDRAHAGHRYITDQRQYGLPEFWTVGLVGDCEDFALWCRQELDGLGIAADLVLCRTEAGEGHLVCSVDGWVLDNRYRWLQCRDDLAYEWIALGRAGVWRRVSG